MKIGVPKEIKNNENRVGLVPGGVRALVNQGHTVFVQKDAGIAASITDEDFEQAGAQVLATAEEVFHNGEMIIKVKEPIQQDLDLLREGHILYTYLHLAPERKLTMELMERGVTAIAYETIQLEDKSLPLLIPMSEVAGRMATQIGSHYLQKDSGGKGVLLSGVPGVKRAKVSILGAGTAGTNAAMIAMGMGAQVTLLDINMTRLQYLDEIFGNTISTLYSNPINVGNAVKEADLLIGTVLLPGARAPKLVTKEMVSSMEEGSVIVDVAIDQGGCIETIRPTSHSNPTYREQGVIHYGVTNMPSAVAKTSAYALTNRTLKYAQSLAELGFKEAIARDSALYRGVNVYNGKVAYKQVADDLNLPFEAVKLDGRH